MQDKGNGPSSLPTWLWDVPSEEPTNPIRGSSELHKAKEGESKGAALHWLGEQAWPFHKASLLLMPILIFLPEGLGFESTGEICFTFV